ncbi:hypothetical protein J4411_01190 [Candidatus Pacearchaeota archaeon]|nr:hypothetical protein [uncultured archaeon]MBS3084509.1 hypothetical protein [Candidatus Pacearchaeota archaeon]
MQHYIPVSLAKGIAEKFGIKIKFEPNNFRIRKYGNLFFITIKSKGKLERHEIEKEISKEEYKILEKPKEKTAEKIRLIKNYKNKEISFDYYPRLSLITAEIEFNSYREAKNFKTNMKDVTGIKKYSNYTLAGI